MEGVPARVLEKLIDAERTRMSGMPSADDLKRGVLRFPINPQATMLEGDAQRNVPMIMKMAQEEMKRKDAPEFRKSTATPKVGQGFSLPLSKGMTTRPMDEIMSFKSIYG
tara:strand:+ start:285 stop:614 length:330 start_codon:yes stop_codon:yes gene_type:complete